MSEVSEAVQAAYTAALKEHLAGAGEATLHRAYELGRKAMSAGLGALELATFHHQALIAVCRQPGQSEENARIIQAAGDFLVESLSPFEITHRGYQEVNALLRNALRFAAVICHELRTPLTSIQASTGMLSEILDPQPQGTVGRLLTNILEGTTALSARMNDLVDVAGFQSGSLSIHPELVNVGHLLREVCLRLEPVVRRAGLRLDFELPPDLPAAKADPRRLDQVVSNLVHNAIKFGWEGKRILVSARHAESCLVVQVRDFGRGIAFADQSRLFQPYVRVDPHQHRTPGLGIGLALCRQLVQAHGGQISVESQLGQGSCFEFSIPLDRPSAVQKEPT
jgi:signal transduction histidine kinase